MSTSIVVSVALLIVVVLLVWYRDAMRRVRRVTRMVWCPLHDRTLSVSLEERGDGRRTAVEQCSAFSPPTAISCGKSCLRITRRPPPAAVTSIPAYL